MLVWGCNRASAKSQGANKMIIAQELERIAEFLNDIIALNRKRREIANEFRGGRGDPYNECKDNGKRNWKKFVALSGDNAIDIHALNDTAREIDAIRAEMRRQFRSFVVGTLVWYLSDELQKICLEFLKDGISTEMLFLDGNDNPRTDLFLRLQKASNGKGAGKIVVNK